MSHAGHWKIKWSETLVVKDFPLSFLSISALVLKNIATFFMPDTALLIDVEDENRVLVQATRNEDGLYYTEDRHNNAPDPPTAVALKTIAAMRAIVEHHAPQVSSATDTDETCERSTEPWGDSL